MYAYFHACLLVSNQQEPGTAFLVIERLIFNSKYIKGSWHRILSLTSLYTQVWLWNDTDPSSCLWVLPSAIVIFSLLLLLPVQLALPGLHGCPRDLSQAHSFLGCTPAHPAKGHLRSVWRPEDALGHVFLGCEGDKTAQGMGTPAEGGSRQGSPHHSHISRKTRQ